MISKRCRIAVASLVVVAAVVLSGAWTFAQGNRPSQKLTLDTVYQDESHCLTDADMRGDGDLPISCWCRDAIIDARYLYFTYLLPRKDPNLNGAFFALENRIAQTCGKTTKDAYSEAKSEGWKWNGPEVLRTYPSDEVISRITPEMRDGRPAGRWVPFTVQLLYRDAQGRVTRTDNYTSREFVPVPK